MGHMGAQIGAISPSFLNTTVTKRHCIPLNPDFDIKSLIDSCFSESLINFDKIWHTYVLNKNETFETPSTKIG